MMVSRRSIRYHIDEYEVPELMEDQEECDDEDPEESARMRSIMRMNLRRFLVTKIPRMMMMMMMMPQKMFRQMMVCNSNLYLCL
jgi:hypothetical protein